MTLLTGTISYPPLDNDVVNYLNFFEPKVKHLNFRCSLLLEYLKDMRCGDKKSLLLPRDVSVIFECISENSEMFAITFNMNTPDNGKHACKLFGMYEPKKHQLKILGLTTKNNVAGRLVSILTPPSEETAALMSLEQLQSLGSSLAEHVLDGGGPYLADIGEPTVRRLFMSELNYILHFFTQLNVAMTMYTNNDLFSYSAS